ncbi:MAG: sulfatase-like hydrolase/transferase [Gammaproteobacteria bacterium]|nr:sulfatase-like hydrolase/transferase [Gammaproteobacteria bacterium]
MKNIITLLCWSLLCMFSIGSAAASKDSTAAGSKPNVLILLFDDMRFDTFSYRGGPVPTPNIDHLAQEGTRFDNAITSTGLCSPSRAALFTGRWGHKTGLDDNVHLYHSRLSELALSEGGLLRRAANSGYNVSYVGKWHLGAQGPSLRGANFIWGHDKDAERHARPFVPRTTKASIDRYYRGELDGNNEKHEYYRTLAGTFESTEAGIEVAKGQQMLRAAARDGQPFFGIVSFEQPHPPYRVPEPYASMFDPQQVELPGNHGIERVNKPMSQDDIVWPWHDVGHMTETDWRKTRAFYYGAIAMIDHAVGELIKTAKEEGLYEDLHIVLLGDQGSMLGEHNLYDKGPYAYDELMRMPLIVRSPGIAPRTISRLVSMLDVAPTLSEIMSLPADGEVDGRSLLPLMERGDKADGKRPDIALYAYEWYNGGWFGIRAIRTPTMKFVWNPGDDTDELYDLENDPLEINNLIGEKSYRKKLLQLIGHMESELVRIKDPAIETFHHHMKIYKK